jgi:hypothetical protein
MTSLGFLRYYGGHGENLLQRHARNRLLWILLAGLIVFAMRAISSAIDQKNAAESTLQSDN